MADAIAARHGALDGMAAPSGTVVIEALPPQGRFIFRGRPASVAGAGDALGIGFPQESCRAAVAERRTVLWLGPDEWLLLVPEDDVGVVESALAEHLRGHPYSLVDISHRQVGLEISGPMVAATLNAGCPLDLASAAFPVGMCTRTVLAKAEIVLWRTGDEVFRLEVARSFSSYVWRFLNEVRREFDV